MPNTPRPTGGCSLDALKQGLQKVKDETEARRRREKEKFTRNARWLDLSNIALDHANAIHGGAPPPSPDDAADFLIRVRAGLADDGLLGWMDAMERSDPTPLHCFVLSVIREALPKAHGTVAKRLKMELTDSGWCGKFWDKVNGVVSKVWGWLQDNVPADGPVTPPASRTPQPEETAAAPIEWTSAGTLKSFAKDMNIHRNTLRNRIKDGTVPHKRLGKLYQVDIRVLPPVHQAKYLPKG